MIQTAILTVKPNEVAGTIVGLTNSGNRIVAMTTITDWQPLPNVPVETVIIVFERNE